MVVTSGERPHTMSPEWVAANKTYMKFQEMNPINGMLFLICCHVMMMSFIGFLRIFVQVSAVVFKQSIIMQTKGSLYDQCM
jgi:hypothetical protein